jgi:hypothetical protein
VAGVEVDGAGGVIEGAVGLPERAQQPAAEVVMPGAHGIGLLAERRQQRRRALEGAPGAGREPERQLGLSGRQQGVGEGRMGALIAPQGLGGGAAERERPAAVALGGPDLGQAAEGDRVVLEPRLGGGFLSGARLQQ